MARQDAEEKPAQERGYQVEMLRASLQRNVIVAMGTGTGKTLIGVLRAREALYTHPYKLVWFLCPTIALCEQQTEVLRLHLPLSRPRSFTSKDGVDGWVEKATWDTALARVRVAVSTPQVLFDALTHGFTRLDKISLLVFDEAHHCTKGHPANRIMTTFYHPYKQITLNALPSILGLSASPANSDISSLRILERNLDSECIAPRKHHKELLKFTNCPEVMVCNFPDDNGLRCTTELHILNQLRDLINQAEKNQPRSKTSQLRQFLRAAERLNHELGSWAGAEYVFNSIEHFKKYQRLYAEKYWHRSGAKDYAMEVICEVTGVEQPRSPIALSCLSPKCQALLEILSRQAGPEFRGLIFVAQRATVGALKFLIEKYEGTKCSFRCGTFVGMSKTLGPTDLGYHDDTSNQEKTLAKFRTGALNLIITTNTLEEGIDIPACNVVISFDGPSTIRSFIQRRGRARQAQSSFIVFVDSKQAEEKFRKVLEKEGWLAKIYRDDERAVPHPIHEAESYPAIQVHSTGARLGMLDAPNHLNIFCAKLLPQQYTTNRPIYNYTENENGHIRATVLLPSVLHPSLQEIDGLKGWRSRRLASADAALQAYATLRTAGLVNEHLLPTRIEDVIDLSYLSCKNIHLLPEPINPWAEAAAQWNKNEVELYAHSLQIQFSQEETLELVMIIPLQIQILIQFPLFRDDKTTMMVRLSPGSVVNASTQNIKLYRHVTNLLLQSVHSHLLESKELMDFVVLFVPDTAQVAMQEFLRTCSGRVPLNEALKNSYHMKLPGLLRSVTRPLSPQLIDCWPAALPCDSTGLQVPLHPLSRRRNFLSRQPKPLRSTSPMAKIETRKMFSGDEEMTMDRLPYVWALVALYIPSITYEVGIYMVAEQLREKVLLKIPFRRMHLLALAIRPTCSERPGRFRSLALVGASFLKFIISVQLFLHHPTWHEGLLSRVKETIISDFGLAQAVRTCGLGKFLITRQFSGKKWAPIWISNDLLSTKPVNSRKVSSRTLGEMVRAIIGAAYVDGGSQKAASCAAAIIPAIKTWHAAALTDGSFDRLRPSSLNSRYSIFRETEQLVGYNFKDRSLLVEALTHPSYYAFGQLRTNAYNRLSFLGDAVLEIVVTQHLLKSLNRTLEVARLQSLRIAVTNHLFLTFLCLEFHVEVDPSTGDVSQPILSRTGNTQDEIYLWTYLQSHSQELATTLSKFRSASRRHCWRIQRDFLRSKRYPWTELAALDGNNVLSDIVKSMFGAVFLDSKANLQNCQLLAVRIGILTRAEQFLRDDTITDHPHIRLQKLYPKAHITYQNYKSTSTEHHFCCAAWINGVKKIDLQGFPNRMIANISVSQALARLLEEHGQRGTED